MDQYNRNCTCRSERIWGKREASLSILFQNDGMALDCMTCVDISVIGNEPLGGDKITYGNVFVCFALFVFFVFLFLCVRQVNMNCFIMQAGWNSQTYIAGNGRVSCVC